MKISAPQKAKLIIGIMYVKEDDCASVISTLKEQFGEIEEESEPYDFSKFTKYYEEEMGSSIKKRFVTFKKLIGMEKLASIKITTNKIEEKFSESGKRRINLDPGYLSKYSLVLASMKERARRIYLGKGIFAEIALNFKKESCMCFDYTYADFKDRKNQEFFLKTRRTLLK